MGSLRAKLIDKNRYVKRYPLIKSPPRYSYLATSDISIEVGSIYFDNAESGSLSYEAQFPDTNYQIVAIARASGADSADVNLFISSKTQGGVTVQASANFTGYVDVFAVRIA